MKNESEKDVQDISSDKNQNLEDYMNKFIDEADNAEISKEDNEFIKYCELYKEKFGKHAYIAEPSGTKEQTIKAIKICLEKNEDLLDKLLYPDYELKNEDKNNNSSLVKNKKKNIFKRIIEAIKNIF